MFDQKPDLKEDEEDDEPQDDGGDEDAVSPNPGSTPLINFLDPHHDQKEEEEVQTRVGLERLYR